MLGAGLATADKRLVYFDMAIEAAETVMHIGPLHEGTDLHPHPIGAFADNTKPAVQLYSADAMVRRDKQEDCVEPNL